MASDNEIARMGDTTLAAKIRAKDLSPVEVVDAALRRMETLEPHLHAFCTPTPDLARTTARQLEKDIQAGQDVGPLVGVPIGIKDLVVTKGIRTVPGPSLTRTSFPMRTTSSWSG
jgi:aspartyl-tRNA(Asn)/glutamyl-tRNA(Gln) amidotransferase subunit A